MNTAMNARRRGRLIYWVIASVWFVCAVGLLGLGLISFGSSVSTETATMLAERRMLTFFGMQVIGFPIATFLPGPMSDLAKSFGLELFNVAQPSMMAFVGDWVILLVLGWLQWFVLLPWLLRVFTQRRSGKIPS
jgi:hypothetical protein